MEIEYETRATKQETRNERDEVVFALYGTPVAKIAFSGVHHALSAVCVNGQWFVPAPKPGRLEHEWARMK